MSPRLARSIPVCDTRSWGSWCPSYDARAADVEKQDAVARRLEVIGEATKRLPQELRDRYPNVPWRDIAGARDVLVHEYFRIDLELAWEMVQDDVPKLAEQVRMILVALEDA
jgi:uncharacterized protein with HEPN domain